LISKGITCLRFRIDNIRRIPDDYVKSAAGDYSIEFCEPMKGLMARFPNSKSLLVSFGAANYPVLLS